MILPSLLLMHYLSIINASRLIIWLKFRGADCLYHYFCIFPVLIWYTYVYVYIRIFTLNNILKCHSFTLNTLLFAGFNLAILAIRPFFAKISTR